MAIDLVVGAAVVCPDGPIGTVGHVDRDLATGGPLGFALHLGPTSREHVFVPLDWVARADARQVVLLVTRTEVLEAANPREEGTVP